MVVLSYYRQEPSGTAEHTRLLSRLSDIPGGSVEKLKLETCFYVLTSDKDISKEDEEKLLWIFGKSFQEEKLGKESFLAQEVSNDKLLLEIGPRLNFSTAFSTNAVSICQSVGLNKISRIEKSLRHLISFTEATTVTPEFEACISSKLHDRMTHCRYTEAVQDFGLNVTPDDVFEVDILGEGRSALERANKELGLAFDDWDLDYYTSLFTDKIKRNPTSVECFDLAQSNSEHSRHWFFRGRLVIDEQEHEKSLFKMVMSTQDHTNNNNVIKFSDNSSAIEGFDVRTFQPENPSEPSSMAEKDVRRHIIFTAETHNFPTGVAPFPGATTGTGGRIRDVQSAGRGAHVVAGTAGYCFGNLQIPDYKLPWEDDTFKYPSNFASPLDIAIEASNGASDYGNKFGEPVLAGFARSFGLSLPGGERREYIKPIMFSGGIGQLEDCHIEKGIPEEGMLVAKIGGPVYRIGVGGGAASSVQVQGDNKSELDFGAVQRGDAEMEQKLNRLIRGCIEMSDKNPIVSIHDQGAGGNGNVLKEIVEPAGAIIQADQFQLADPTISILELWGAEYQESNAVLLNQHNKELLTRMGTRERCPIAFVGTVTGDGKIRLENFKQKEAEGSPVSKKQKLFSAFPVDLELEHVLGSMPRKVFKLDRMKPNLTPLSLPENIQIRETLERVLRLPSVASKRYLTNKVDRCVTGLVAQQQCVGPLHTPLADVAVTALSYFDMVGSATAIGEQPIKGLIDPACGARMSVGEALTNLVFAKITSLKDVKCSSNWMWPAKLPGEGAALYDACKAMCDVMEKLGIAVDGGKDSLSMAARVDDVTVKAPGTLVVSAYVGCPDISLTVTPDLKCPNSKGVLLHIDLSRGKHRLGGSALAQCQEQIGDESPGLEDPQLFSRAFNVTQSLITERLLSAGHDISDGGLITCVMEMAFAGNCGIEVDIITKEPDIPAVDVYFAEELGLLLEVAEINLHKVLQAYSDQNVPCVQIGYSQRLTVNEVQLMLNGHEILVENMTVLRDIWEETSFQLEKRQASPCCVEQESTGLKYRISPPYHLSFDPEIICFMPKEGTVNQWYRSASKHDRPRAKVAVLREEGSNSDREMAAVLHMAGFTVWDINMQDLCSGEITLDEFEGLVFVGGFSYADVCGSAKGWAATAVFNKKVHDQLTKFRERTDTFSLGVCNGCQLMALLGWVAPDSAVSESGDQDFQQGVLLDHNASERFECRFSTVKVYNSPSIMLTGLEGTTFGMWSAHGEGRMVFKSPLIKSEVLQENLAPVRYVDDENQPTVVYPFNPNGSPDGIAALCSVDGRHLAIMPHPERCFLPWQCPWIPESLQGKLDVTPWFKMFQNAFDWCMKHKQS